MLCYLGENAIAERIHNAWLRTLEEGIHTYDIFKEKTSKLKVGTKEFAEAVIKFLGEKPHTLPAISYKDTSKFTTLTQCMAHKEVKRQLVGIDIYVYSQDTAASFVKNSSSKPWTPLTLHMISNRGARLWPEGHPETFCVDQWRMRFMHKDKKSEVTYPEIIKMIQEIHDNGYDIIGLENLYLFDGKSAFSSPEG
jgi:isocitrate dehydrogenase